MLSREREALQGVCWVLGVARGRRTRYGVVSRTCTWRVMWSSHDDGVHA